MFQRSAKNLGFFLGYFGRVFFFFLGFFRNFRRRGHPVLIRFTVLNLRN